MSWLDNLFGIGSGDPNAANRNALTANAQAQQQFGGQLQGGYGANQGGINNTIGMLQGAANGQNSVSALQLQQGLQQAQAQQMSMAAGASPQNQAMAARNAMLNSGNAASGMMGQQAMAGLQERQQAMNTLAQTQLGQSQQNMQGALGAYSGANQAYGTMMGTPQNTWGNVIGGALAGAAGIAGQVSGAHH